MNIFNRVTLQCMKKSRTRTIVTVVGVILSTAMITAVATFAVSLQNYMVKGSIVKYGDWHVGFVDVDSSFMQGLTHDRAAAGMAAYENMGYAELEGGKNPDKPYLFIAGFSRETFNTLPVHLVSGRLPENSGEILVPAHVAANGGVTLAVGDSLSLAVGSRIGSRPGTEDNGKLGQHDPYMSGDEAGTSAVRERFVPIARRNYKVVGICERPAFEEYSAPGYTLITTADSGDIADSGDLGDHGNPANPAAQTDSFSVFVTLANPRQAHAYAERTAGTYSYVLNDNVLRFMGVSGDAWVNTLLYSTGGILVALIMIGSIFLIYNSFTISMNERMRQFGILSSVGATAKQLCGSVLFEGFCIGVIGIPIGIIAGIGSMGLVILFVAGRFGKFAYSTVPLNLTVTMPVIAAAAIVSMVTIFISAYIPARRAAGRPVMESIRQTNEVRIQPQDVRISKLARRVYGLEGILALKNFKRNKRRYGSIVFSLTLSVLLFVSASAFGNNLKTSAERTATDSDYDICFTAQDMDESEMFRLYDQLKTVSGIYDSSYQAVMTYSCAAHPGEFSDLYRESAGYGQEDETVDLPMNIQFIEDRQYLRFLRELGLPAEEYTGQNAKMIAVAKAKLPDQAKAPDKSKLPDQAKTPAKAKSGNSRLVDMFAVPSMNVTIAPRTNEGPLRDLEQEVNITFVDTIPTDTLPREPHQVNQSFVFMVVAPWQLKAQFEISGTPGAHANQGLTFLSENSALSMVEMETIIHDAGITDGYTLYNLNEILEDNRSIIFVVDVFTYVFVSMISLIATANVFNTISTNIKLRRRELAMLRSVGMSDRDFMKMMNFECAFYGMRTLLSGLPLAGIFSWLIYKGMAAGGADIDYVFPWGSMAASVAGVFSVVFITMLYAVSRLKRENIIEALRDDMT